MSVAKLFTHGGSQAVRLPKDFRFAGSEVHVRRVGDEVVLSPRPAASVDTMIDALLLFEPDVHLQREQPSDADERAPIAPRR
jgi:antitoxin VapB